MARPAGLAAAIIAHLLLAAVLVPLTLSRFIDPDEGYYLYAGRLALEGKQPYLDFFFPQMPLLPYFYGWWMGLWGTNWYAGRMLSGLAAGAIGSLIFFAVRRKSRHPWSPLLAVVLYVFSALSAPWMITAKTYSLSCLFAVTGLMALERARENNRPAWSAVGGVALGLVIGVRLLFLVLVPVFLVAAWHGRRHQRLAFAAGFLAAIAPVVYYFLRSPEVFIFNNLGFHSLNSGQGLVADLPQKFRLLLFLLGIYPLPMLNIFSLSRLQFPILFIPFLILVGKDAARLRLTAPAASVLMLMMVSLLPTPAVHTQYFSVVIPLLLLSLAGSFDRVVDGSRRVRAALAVAVLLYVVVGLNILWDSTVTGLAVPGVREESKQDAKISTVEQVSRKVDELAAGGEVVSIWPGYLLETRTRAWPGLENHFGFFVAGKLNPEARVRYHLMDEEELSFLVRSRRPLAVVGRLTPKGLFPSLGYATIWQQGGISIMAPPEVPGRPKI